MVKGSSITKPLLNAENPSSSDSIADAPRSFYCPLSGEIMRNPVIAECGNSFEREHFDSWIKEKRWSPCTRQDYGSLKAPVNHSLKRSIQQWQDNVRDYGAPGPALKWLAYTAPRTGFAFTQPVVLSDGYTLDLKQVDTWVVGNKLSVVGPKVVYREWELPVPNRSLRNLMLESNVGDGLEPIVPAIKRRVHDGALRAWNTREQIEAGGFGALLFASCSFITAWPIMACLGAAGVAHSAAAAAVYPIAAVPVGALLGCWLQYRLEAGRLKDEIARRGRRQHILNMQPQPLPDLDRVGLQEVYVDAAEAHLHRV